jgi:AcrR family transcriptional regulator
MRQLSPTTRDSILRGTLHLRGQRAFTEITTKQIARSASVAEATVFRYFPHKVEILQAIVAELVSGFFRDLEEILQLMDGPAEKLVALCRRHTSFGARNRDLLALHHRQLCFVTHETEKCLEGFRRFLDTIEGILREGIKSGVFRADLDVETTVLLFGSVNHHVLLDERLYRKKPHTEASYTRAAEQFHALLLRSTLAKESRV